MARLLKDKYIGAKVSTPFFDEVIAYTEAHGDMTQGDFVRVASEEYLENHPIEVKKGKKK